jgi:hypothetical protein
MCTTSILNLSSTQYFSNCTIRVGVLYKFRYTDLGKKTFTGFEFVDVPDLGFTDPTDTAVKRWESKLSQVFHMIQGQIVRLNKNSHEVIDESKMDPALLVHVHRILKKSKDVGRVSKQILRSFRRM